MPYKVFLVDDEPWTMIYLKKVFKWQEMGFEVIGESNNSVEALDMIIDTMPDVVFTDIRMPKMSGIELMQKVRARGLSCVFVIVSGFADFTYAQEAIKYGAFEYCLKPINGEKADEILKRLGEGLKNRETASNIALNANVAAAAADSAEEALSDVEANSNFEKMLCYIKTNLHKKLQLKELAKEFYLHPNYCCHLFSKVSGKTFSEYLTDLRMKKAESLMLQKNLTVEQVAHKSGYPDYFYFNKVFKKYYGVTPAEYRKMHIRG